MTDLADVDVADSAAVLSPLAWLAWHSPESVPEEYADYHSDLADWPEPGERQARVVFRGAAKSTVTTALVLWAIQTGRTKGLVWVRAIDSDCLADREAMERLGALAGMRVVVHARRQLVIVNGVPVWTKTPRGAVRGLKHVTGNGTVVRPDTAVIDDIETRDTARSAEQTKRMERWLESDLFGTAGHRTPLRVIMLGTPITPTAIIAKAMRREEPYDTWLAPLVVPYVTDGVPAWPTMYDPELEGRTEDGAWANEYLLDPLPEGSLMFPPKRTVWRDDVEPGIVWVGIDPAGDGSDATSATAARSDDHGVGVVDAFQWNGHMEDAPLELAAFIRRLIDAGHTVAGVNVEAVGAWKFMANQIANNIAPIPVVYETPITSKTERGLQLARWHKMECVWMSEHLRGSVLDVEMHTWTREGFTVTGHDDAVDSFVWAAGAATFGWSQEPPRLAA